MHYKHTSVCVFLLHLSFIDVAVCATIVVGANKLRRNEGLLGGCWVCYIRCLCIIAKDVV